jgi:hypothetical protein
MREQVDTPAISMSHYECVSATFGNIAVLARLATESVVWLPFTLLATNHPQLCLCLVLTSPS